MASRPSELAQGLASKAGLSWEMEGVGMGGEGLGGGGSGGLMWGDRARNRGSQCC